MDSSHLWSCDHNTAKPELSLTVYSVNGVKSHLTKQYPQTVYPMVISFEPRGQFSFLQLSLWP